MFRDISCMNAKKIFVDKAEINLVVNKSNGGGKLNFTHELIASNINNERESTSRSKITEIMKMNNILDSKTDFYKKTIGVIPSNLKHNSFIMSNNIIKNGGKSKEINLDKTGGFVRGPLSNRNGSMNSLGMSEILNNLKDPTVKSRNTKDIYLRNNVFNSDMTGGLVSNNYNQKILTSYVNKGNTSNKINKGKFNLLKFRFQY